MGILDIMSRIVSIFAGIVGGLVGITTLVEKCKSYIERCEEQTEKDPSASLAATDGSDEDCLSNRYSTNGGSYIAAFLLNYRFIIAFYQSEVNSNFAVKQACSISTPSISCQYPPSSL